MPCCFAVAHATLSDRFSRVPYDACLGFPQTLAGVLSLARRTESLLRLGEAIHAATCGAAHLKEGAALAALTPPILQICCAVWLGRAAGAPACRAAPLPWGAQSKAAACRTCTSCQFRPRHGLAWWGKRHTTVLRRGPFWGSPGTGGTCRTRTSGLPRSLRRPA